MRTYAIGLDLGAPLLEVARRGFSSPFSNQMGQLGRWISSAASGSLMPMLHLADDLAGSLAELEAGAAEQVRVGLAVPGWLGWCDRHHIARLLDASGTCQLVWASSPVVAAFGTNVVNGSPLVPELVVAIDLDLGISASVVAIDRLGIREMVAASAPPHWSNRVDSLAVVIAELATLAREIGVLSVNRVVLVAGGTGSGALVDRAVREVDRAWGDCPVDTVRSRAEIARSAVMLADMDSFEVVGIAPRSVGVMLDDVDAGRSMVHVIVARNTAVPCRCVASFDLGPEDGAEVYLDVYEELPDEPGLAGRTSDRRGHRLVMTARLSDGSSAMHAQAAPLSPDPLEVSFVVGVDGQLRLEPADRDDPTAWTCTWADSRMVTRSASSVTAAVAGGTIPSSGERPQNAPEQMTREMSPPLGLGEALGQAERIVSRQIGRPVAIRSAMALFGCSDRDEPEVLHERADRLASVLEGCTGNEAARFVHRALDIARRAVDAPLGRVFAGGSAREVAGELARVVEHLAVVIGAVTPVERNRLVLDGQLLGLDHQRARALVDELIEEADVDSDGRPDELRDLTAIVVVSASGFRLAPVGVHLDPDQAAMRVLLLE